MPYYVYEPDPLVRVDIFETLAEEFGTLVYPIPSLCEAAAVAGRSDEDGVFVLSVNEDDGWNDFAEVLPRLTAKTVVVLGHRCPEVPIGAPAFTFVPRPFSSASLLAAIKSASSGQQ